jgi:hypothetical protein
MKNVLLMTAALSSSLLFISAEGVNTKKGTQMMQPRNFGTTTHTMPQGMMPMPSMMSIPTTGDATIDAQLVTLFKEQEEKIKAIRQEYEVKIKAITGDKKIIERTMMMGSGTPPMMEDMRKRMEDDMHHNASGTRVMMGSTTRQMMDGEHYNGKYDNGSGTYPMMRGENKDRRDSSRPSEGGMPKNRETSKPLGLFQGLFKSLLGANAQDAQAESQ